MVELADVAMVVLADVVADVAVVDAVELALAEGSVVVTVVVGPPVVPVVSSPSPPGSAPHATATRMTPRAKPGTNARKRAMTRAYRGRGVDRGADRPIS
jgi:hypothetical protein